MEDNVQVVLVSNLTSYTVPSYPISVPTSSTSTELNTLVKDLLKESHELPSDIDFVFLIDNEYLTSSISQHLSKKQITNELVEIQYLEKQKTPAYSDEIRQDDLISSVKRLDNFVLTGAYDGTVQLWTIRNRKLIFSIELDDKVKCVDWLSFNDSGATFVTTSFDQTARIWSWDAKSNKVVCAAVCRGHTETVMTAAARYIAQDASTSDFFTTGSWDCTLKLWSSSTLCTDLSEETGGISHARKSQNKTPTRVPRLTLAGHKETITRVCWLPTAPAKSTATSTQLISVSWDHSLRVWDCQACCEQKGLGGSELRSVVSSHAFNDADASLQGIVTASSDNRVRIYDLRARDALSVIGFHGHTGWLTSVAWAPHTEYQFVTGSIDRSVRLWDTRNTKCSLFDLMGHTDMVTDVDWTETANRSKSHSLDTESPDNFILSSSADGTVKVYSYPK